MERQGWGEIKEGRGAPLRKLLEARDGQPTIVRMANGEELVLCGVAGCRDYGDMRENVRGYTSSDRASGEIHFFYMSEPESLWDPATGAMLMEQTPAPGEM